MLTGRTDQPQKIAALDAGAADYVTKPFDVEELFARMRAVARRGTADGGQPTARIGAWTVDLARAERDAAIARAMSDGRALREARPLATAGAS